MKAVTIERRMTGLEEELTDLRRQLAEVQAQLLDTFNREKIAELRAKERALEDQIATVEATIAAGDRARAEAQAKEAEQAAETWAKLHAEARAELDQGCDKVLAKLRETAEAFLEWKATAESWEVRRTELGSPAPELPRMPGTLSDFLYPAVPVLGRRSPLHAEVRGLLNTGKRRNPLSR